MQRRFRLAALVAFLAGSVLSAGQTPQSTLPQTPTFKLQVDYVDVDVLVTDRDGRFVSNLTRDDFEVFEDRRPQTIANFSVVNIPIERADRPLYSPEPFEPDVESNETPFEGRLYVMILDDVHIDATRTPNVRRAARQFIERYLGANDMMAIVQTGGRTEAAQEFTSNRRLLLSSVDKFMGQKLESATLARNSEYNRQAGVGFEPSRVLDPYEQERAYKARQTLGLLQKVAEWYSGVRGRRKTILFVSEGIDYDISNIIRQYDSPSNAAAGIYDDIRQTIAATARSNVSIYGIDPRGLSTLAEDTIGVSSLADQPALGIGSAALRNELMWAQESLRALADETGGFAVVNTNQFANAFDRIVTDNSTYYVLAYYPAVERKDGKFHRIEVRTKRPGLTVRARRGYMAPKAKPAAPKTTSAKGPSSDLVDALQSPLNISGLGMRIFAAPFKGAAPNASVLLGIEVLGRDLQLAANGKLDLSYLAVDAKGKSFGARTDTVTLNLRPETRTRVEETGLRMLNRLDLPPGRYQLHVASHDVGGGALGSVLYDLEIPDYSKVPFAMSGLLMTSMSSSAMVTVKGDEQSRTLLPAAPIAQRSFPENDEIALFTEIYDDGTTAPHKVDIVTTVRTDEGRIYFKNEEERDSKELQGKRGGYGYSVRVPLSGFAPGPYVLTVEARSRQGNNLAASRQIRINVVPNPAGR